MESKLIYFFIFNYYSYGIASIQSSKISENQPINKSNILNNISYIDENDGNINIKSLKTYKQKEKKIKQLTIGQKFLKIIADIYNWIKNKMPKIFMYYVKYFLEKYYKLMISIVVLYGLFFLWHGPSFKSLGSLLYYENLK
jgi:hypothetical protein